MLALGSFFGGVVVELFGPKACFCIDASCFFISNMFLYALRSQMAYRKEVDGVTTYVAPSEHEKGELSYSALKQGWKYFSDNPAVFIMCFSKATDSIVYGTSEVANIRIVETMFPHDVSIHLGLTYLVYALLLS